MNLTANVQARTIFWIVGFIIPFLIIVAQVLLDIGSAPLVVFALTWFGLALIIYLGVYEE